MTLCIVQVFSQIAIVSKLLMMSFKKTLDFILTLSHSFRAVLGDNLVFLPRPGKYSSMSNCLNFFITDCTVDLRIVSRFEIVL